MTIRRDYTEEEKKSFQRLRFHHPNPRARNRFEVLWLHANGEKAPRIAILTDLCVASVRKYIRLYEKGGIALVALIDSNHPKSALEPYKAQIIEEFNARPPVTAKEAAARLKGLTGVDLKPRAVEAFMVKIGMAYRKVGTIPAKANIDAQETFKKNPGD